MTNDDDEDYDEDEDEQDKYEKFLSYSTMDGACHRPNVFDFHTIR